MPAQDFLPGGEVTLSVIMPRHASLELKEKQRSIGERTAEHVAALAIAVEGVQNVSGFRGGFSEDGKPYLHLLVRPSKQNPLESLATQVLAVSERLNGIDPSTLKRELARGGVPSRFRVTRGGDDVRSP